MQLPPKQKHDRCIFHRMLGSDMIVPLREEEATFFSLFPLMDIVYWRSLSWCLRSPRACKHDLFLLACFASILVRVFRVDIWILVMTAQIGIHGNSVG